MEPRELLHFYALQMDILQTDHQDSLTRAAYDYLYNQISQGLARNAERVKAMPEIALHGQARKFAFLLKEELRASEAKCEPATIYSLQKWIEDRSPGFWPFS